MTKHVRRLPWLISIPLLTLLGTGSAKADSVITGVTATATSELTGGPFDRRAIHTVDGSGLSGVTHIDGGEGFFWESVGITEGFGVDRAPAITFNLHGLYDLSSMQVWNFAEAS